MMKRLLIAWLCICLLAVLAACESPSFSGDETTTPVPARPEESITTTTTTAPPAESTTTTAPPTTPQVPENPYDDDGFPNEAEDGATKRY